MRSLALASLLATGTAAVIACSQGKAASTCKAQAPTDCAPLYDPTYEQIFTRTLKPTCAAGGANCHGGGQGGFKIDDIDATYTRLTERLSAGKPECSELVDRLYSTETGYSMPPGTPLSEAERCSIVKWIAAGAKR